MSLVTQRKWKTVIVPYRKFERKLINIKDFEQNLLSNLQKQYIKRTYKFGKRKNFRKKLEIC